MKSQNLQWGLNWLFVLASVLFSANIQSAAVIEPATQPVWNVAPFELKYYDLQKDSGTRAYQTWFEPGTWSGDLIEWAVAANGARSAGAWTAKVKYVINTAANTEYWKARKIITRDASGNQVAFRWNMISADQRSMIDAETDVTLDDAYASSALNYLRGDRSHEYPSGIYRYRSHPLGAMVHSTPLYIGPPAGKHADSSYTAFKTSNASRAGRVYVGSNDGMLHAFDASNGDEVFAYIPSMLIPKIADIASVGFKPTYFVDGGLATADVPISGAWKTVLVGGLGAGEKGLFAVDITSATMTDETSSTGGNRKILWEVTHNRLGYIHEAPIIRKLPDGNWYAITGNGFGSAWGNAELLLVNISTGAVTSIMADSTTGSGLAAPAIVDTDSDGDVDIAYAGDLKGNLWKFDLATKTVRALPLYNGGADNPITSRPDVARHPFGGYTVYFGTGSLLSAADASNAATQYAMAVRDKPGFTGTVTTGQLQDQSLIEVVHPDLVDFPVRVGGTNIPNYSRLGWRVALPYTGERMLGQPVLRAGRLQFVSSHPVTVNGRGVIYHWINELDWLSGGHSGMMVSDFNGDGAIDNGDGVTVDGVFKYPVGQFLGEGYFSQPSFGLVSNGIDAMFINALRVEGTPTEGDVIGGHFDHDMDTSLGGGTDNHKHEYDDSYNINYADYFNLQSGNGVNDVGIGGKRFIVTLANADLSPGVMIRINGKEWSVVDYQNMIQQRIEAYDGVTTDTFQDEEGSSLIFTLNDLNGDLRLTVDPMAIINGALHPTITGCVKDDPVPLSEQAGQRWRNGALTMQLIDLDAIGAADSQNNTWIAQQPTDLRAGMTGGGIIANPANDSGFLYEATLFWHYGHLSGSLIGLKPCYGEEGWVDAVKVETGRIDIELLEGLYPGFADNLAVILDYINQLDAVTCDKGSGYVCRGADEYKLKFEEFKQVFEYAKNYLEFREDYKEDVGQYPNIDGVSSRIQVHNEALTRTPHAATLLDFGRQSWAEIR